MPSKFTVHPDIVYPKIAVPIEMERRNVWLLRTLDFETNRRAMSGLVYDDDIDTQYSYSNSVPNGRQIAEGDLVLLRDNEVLLGAAVVQRIRQEEKSFERLKCPTCGSAKLYWRRSTRDWRCDGACLRPNRLTPDARSTQDPVRESVKGIAYTAEYPDTWSDLAGSMLAGESAQLSDSWNPQNSIVRLNPVKVLDFFNHLKFTDWKLINPNEQREVAIGGFVERTVKSRLGQTQFRAHLVSKFGATCAFTGACYLAALDAAHLYSYAETGEHREGGGLLMRKDLHRLFDLGMIGVTPEQRIALHSDLITTQYGSLLGAEIKVDLRGYEKSYLNSHFHAHEEHLRISA